MILANQQVATFLERKRVPTVYRVHDMPDPFRLDHLLDVLASLDLPTPPFDPMLATPIEVRRVARETSEYLDRNVPRNRGKVALVQQVLRAQARAVYQTAEHRPLRPGPGHLLPLHLAHPPLPRPAGAPRTAGRAGRWARPHHLHAGRVGRALLAHGAAGGQDRAARPTTSPWRTCSGGGWTARGGAPSSRARSSAWCPPGPSCSSSSCTRASCRRANCRATTTS